MVTRPVTSEEGEQLFIENCAICHGPEGDAVPRVNLARGKFRHGSSDEELSQTIKNGIPGTAMPPGNFHEHQITALIAYLRSMSASAIRIPSLWAMPRGAKRSWRAKVNASIATGLTARDRISVPISAISAVTRRAAQLQRSILDPDAEMLPQNRFFRVVTRDGTTITGRLLNLDTFTVQMMDSNQQLRSFVKSELEGVRFRRQIADAVLSRQIKLRGGGRRCGLPGHSKRSQQIMRAARSFVFFRRRFPIRRKLHSIAS